MSAETIFTSNFFKRSNEDDDAFFYSSPRLSVHTDEIAINNLSTILGKLLPKEGTILDLMSSWRSHLPNGIQPNRVVGLGLNAKEMAENPQLDSYVVHNLNKYPSLPFDEMEFDAVICTVSIQYLTKPIEVFCEVNRILRSNGVFIISFSNHYYSAKVIAAWIALTDKQRTRLISYYFEASGNWAQPKLQSFIPKDSEPLYVVWAHKPP